MPNDIDQLILLDINYKHLIFRHAFNCVSPIAVSNQQLLVHNNCKGSSTALPEIILPLHANASNGTAKQYVRISMALDEIELFLAHTSNFQTFMCAHQWIEVPHSYS